MFKERQEEKQRDSERMSQFSPQIITVGKLLRPSIIPISALQREKQKVRPPFMLVADEVHNPTKLIKLSLQRYGARQKRVGAKINKFLAS
jgi:hypothetical protein